MHPSIRMRGSAPVLPRPLVPRPNPDESAGRQRLSLPSNVLAATAPAIDSRPAQRPRRRQRLSNRNHLRVPGRQRGHRPQHLRRALQSHGRDDVPHGVRLPIWRVRGRQPGVGVRRRRHLQCRADLRLDDHLAHLPLACRVRRRPPSTSASKMRSGLACMLAITLAACSSAHPIDERYPRCEPGQRCPRPGEHCLPTQAFGMRCLPPCVHAWDCLPSEICVVNGCFPPGPIAAGEPCSHIDDCVAGFACTGVDPLYQGLVGDRPPRCRARCDAPPDAGLVRPCPGDQFCTRRGIAAAAAACITLCDPASGAGCESDELCVSGTACIAAATAAMCPGVTCPSGRICDQVRFDCLSPVEWAARYPAQ